MDTEYEYYCRWAWILCLFIQFVPGISALKQPPLSSCTCSWRNVECKKVWPWHLHTQPPLADEWLSIFAHTQQTCVLDSSLWTLVFYWRLYGITRKESSLTWDLAVLAGVTGAAEMTSVKDLIWPGHKLSLLRQPCILKRELAVNQNYIFSLFSCDFVYRSRYICCFFLS